MKKVVCMMDLNGLNDPIKGSLSHRIQGYQEMLQEYYTTPEEVGYWVVLESESDCFTDRDQEVTKFTERSGYILFNGMWEDVEHDSMNDVWIITQIMNNSFGIQYAIESRNCSELLLNKLRGACGCC